ncbi:MAG: hypothetical protein ACFBSG_02065 [Leptolyngbyaceae cyanobacterium]
MKSDADTIRSFLLGLLEHFGRIDSSPSGKVDDLPGNLPPVDPASAIAPSPRSSTPGSSNPVTRGASSAFISVEMPPISELGELPSVQDHFQTVLKRRLQSEISQKPPLFPWETSTTDYPVELSAQEALPWMAQLRSLALPTTLPDDILAGLLDRCQALLVESLQPGVQLVQAVESLFPHQPQAMDQIAGLVLANTTVRGTGRTNAEALKAAFPDGYEGANPQQQVTLTMLAAQDIFNTLTLALTSEVPLQRRQWLTAEGTITVSAHFQAGTPAQVSLMAQVPQASQMVLPSLGKSVTQTQAGTLSLTLPAPVKGQVYPLQIFYDGVNAEPLTFAISTVAD